MTARGVRCPICAGEDGICNWTGNGPCPAPAQPDLKAEFADRLTEANRRVNERKQAVHDGVGRDLGGELVPRELHAQLFAGTDVDYDELLRYLKDGQIATAFIHEPLWHKAIAALSDDEAIRFVLAVVSLLSDAFLVALMFRDVLAEDQARHT